MLPYLIVFSSLLSTVSSICGTRPPSDGDYEILTVGVNRGPLTSVLNDARDEGVVGLAMNSPKEECDATCLYTLEHYNAPHNHSSLVVRKELSELIPVGYSRISNRSTVYCARTQGGCGATVPVWRHYALNGSGIYHTYTLDDSTVGGYTREPLPLCYAWTQYAVDQEGSGIEALLSSDDRLKRNTVMVKDAKTCDLTFPNRTKMEMISEYFNNRTGSQQDHLYTLKTSKELQGYNKTKDLGLILTRNDSSCSCLVTLVQTLDNQTGIFHRIDHKLMRADAELNRIFEKYNRTGETFYCAAQKGQCGASLPLYKHFDFIHIDSIITTSDKEVPPHSYRYPSEPLCWIWSLAYDPTEEEEDWTTRWNTTVKTTPSNTTTVKTTPLNVTTIRTSPSTVTTRLSSTPTSTASTTLRVTTHPSNTTTRPTTPTLPYNSTTRPTTPTLLFNSTTRPTTMGNSTTRTTPSTVSPLALDEIIVRMVRSALGNDTNWKEAVRSKLREITDRL